MLSERKMAVKDIPISKLQEQKGISLMIINGARDNMYTADNICKMIEFLIDNIFVQFGVRLFCQVIGILMGPIVLHYLLIFSFTHMRTNFWTI